MQRLEGSTYVPIRYGNGDTKKFISVYSRFIKVLLFDQLLLNRSTHSNIIWLRKGHIGPTQFHKYASIHGDLRKKNKRMGKIIERQAGVEPVTFGLGSRRSTNWAIAARIKRSLLEPIPGLEPGTYALRMRCSTNWAISAFHNSSICERSISVKCGAKVVNFRNFQ